MTKVFHKNFFFWPVYAVAWVIVKLYLLTCRVEVKGPLPDYLDRIEREAILEALAKTRFNRTAAAKLLGITFRALRYRMARLGINEPL